MNFFKEFLRFKLYFNIVVWWTETPRRALHQLAQVSHETIGLNPTTNRPTWWKNLWCLVQEQEMLWTTCLTDWIPALGFIVTTVLLLTSLGTPWLSAEYRSHKFRRVIPNAALDISLTPENTDSFPHGLIDPSATSKPECRNKVVCKISVCTNILGAFSVVWTISSAIRVWAALILNHWQESLQMNVQERTMSQN